MAGAVSVTGSGASTGNVPALHWNNNDTQFNLSSKEHRRQRIDTYNDTRSRAHYDLKPNLLA